VRGRTSDLKYPVIAMDINRTTIVRDFAVGGLAGPSWVENWWWGGVPFFAIGFSFSRLGGGGVKGEGWMDGGRVIRR